MELDEFDSPFIKWVVCLKGQNTVDGTTLINQVQNRGSEAEKKEGSLDKHGNMISREQR